MRNAVQFLERADDLGLASEALSRLAHIQGHVGELADAAKLARRARTLARNDIQRALADLELATIDLNRNKLETVIQRVDGIDASLRDVAATQRHGIVAASELVRARSWSLLGRPSLARVSIERASQLARLSGERRLEVEARARLGRLEIDVGNDHEAELVLRDALLLAQEIEDPFGEALAQLFVGTLQAEAERPGAQRSFELAWRRAHDVGLNRIEALADALRARWALRDRDYERALELSEAALALLERSSVELPDRIVITATRVLALTLVGSGEQARTLERSLRRGVKRQNQRLRSRTLRERHERFAADLLATTLTLDGPLYPRRVRRNT